jgi:hypothetical protein
MWKQLPGTVTHHNDSRQSVIEDTIVGNKKYICTHDGYERYDIHTFEQFDLEILDTYDIYSKVENPVPVLFVRDVMNWVSSLIKKEGEFFDRLYSPYTDGIEGFEKSIMEIYKGHLMEIAGWTNFTTRIPGAIHVGYNNWFSDVNYRRKLAQEMGFEFTDLGFKEVTTFGDASSFDGDRFNGRAHEMQVLHRYEHLDSNCVDRIRKDTVLMNLIEITKEKIGPMPWV